MLFIASAGVYRQFQSEQRQREWMRKFRYGRKRNTCKIVFAGLLILVFVYDGCWQPLSPLAILCRLLSVSTLWDFFPSPPRLLSKCNLSLHYSPCNGKDGSGVVYTFINGIDKPIKGIGKFEDYLLKSYLSEDLTEDGKLALVEMKKRRIEKDKGKAKYARKKQRAN